MFIRTTGAAIGLAGLLLTYHAASIHGPVLIGLLTILGVLLFTATALLVAADVSTAKEKPLHEA